MIKLTKAEALHIQMKQVEHYVSIYGNAVRRIVAEATTASALRDGEHEVVLINRHIPRGGAIETLIAKHQNNVAQHCIAAIGARILSLPGSRTRDLLCPLAAPFLCSQAAIEIALASGSRHIDMSRTFFRMPDPEIEVEACERANHERHIREIGLEIAALEGAGYRVQCEFILVEPDDLSYSFD